MNRILAAMVMGILVCLLPLGGVQAEAPEIEASMLVTGSITADTQGRVASYQLDQLDDLPPAVRRMLQDIVPQWRFQPVTRDAIPVQVKADMSVRLMAEKRDEDSVAIRLVSTWFGESESGLSYTDRDRPSYPTRALRELASGTVYLLVKIGRDGKVLDAAAEQVNLLTRGNEHQMKNWRKWFADSAADAVMDWTFHVPTEGEQASQRYWVARIPIMFVTGSLARQWSSSGAWHSYIPGPKHLIPWADPKLLAGSSADSVPIGGVQMLGGSQELQLLNGVQTPVP